MPTTTITTILLLFFLPLNTHSLTSPTDIAALKSFKSSITPTSIPPSSCLSTWVFSSDPCSLPRRTRFICAIACDSLSSRVVSITLDPAGYSGTLSPLLSLLTHLTTLDLSDNSFFGSIPPSLSSLSLLQSLSFRSNSLSGSIPSSIFKLKSLQEVDFSNNLLSGSLPNSFSGLVNLKRLDLSFNKFTGVLPKLPPNLLEFAIKSNLLSGSVPESSFKGLNQLETVEMSENLFTGVLQGWFFNLPALQQVNLSNNTLTRVEIWKPRNGQYSSLVAVDLGFNKIEGHVPVEFAGFPVISSLSMRYNRLHGPIPWQYGKKESLKRLYLDGNYLNGTPPRGLVSGGGDAAVSGSLGDNCLQGCPAAAALCSPAQKSTAVCKQVYGGKRPRV